VIYAIASYVYRWVVTFSIIFFLADFLGPQLKILSQMLAAFSLGTMFIWPTYRMVKNINQRGRLPDMKTQRVAVTAAVALGLLAVACLVPLPVSRVREVGLVTVDPGHSDPVVLAEPATLTSLHVQEGQVVKQGQLLARFSSRELVEELALAESRRDEKLVEKKFLEDIGLSTPRGVNVAGIANDINAAAGEAAGHQNQAALIAGRLASLRDKVAPRDGVVMGLVNRGEVGKLFDRNNQQSKPICTVGDPTRLLIKVPVSSIEYKLLAEDLPANGSLDVSVYVHGRTDRLFKGKVVRLPRSSAKQVPYGLTSRSTGPVAVQQGGENGQELIPVAQVYLVEVELTDPDASIKAGALVNAKIHCQWRTLAWWLKRAASEALDFGLYQ